MKIWLINNYVTLPKYGHFCRQYYFGKHLKAMGHDPIVFAGSHPHNSQTQLIQDNQKFSRSEECLFPWILVKTLNYEGSRFKQILSMFQFYFNGRKAAKWTMEHYGKPDVILGSSAHPLAALLAVQLGKKYGCRSVVEVRDLWPESIVVFEIAGPHHPAVVALRWLEKWLYKNAGAVVFTMEGAYDYIIEQGWEKDIPKSKVFHVNNGVDLKTFDYNREMFLFHDPDLSNSDTINAVYTGSIRQANQLGVLVDAAKELQDYRIKLLIWGGGDDLESLRQRVTSEGITNIVFKGHVEKKYIPSIVSQADINIVHWKMNPILKYGVSYNKLFDYLAAGHPIFSTVRPGYSILEKYRCGMDTEGFTPKELAMGIQHLASLPPEELAQMGQNARKAAKEYDFQNLTQKLINVIEG